MSDSLPTLPTTSPDDTTVPSDTQKALRDYWQTFSPNRGVIINQTIWDDGGTAWDDNATIWPS